MAMMVRAEIWHFGYFETSVRIIKDILSTQSGNEGQQKDLSYLSFFRISGKLAKLPEN